MMEINTLWIQFRDYLYTHYHLDNQSIYTLISCMIVFLTYYCHGWFFVFADWYGFLNKYCIRNGTHRIPSLSQQWAAIREATLDTFLLKPLILYFIYPYIIEPYVSFDDTPSLTRILVDSTLMLILFSTSLFFIHGALHKITFLYKHVHKRHHSFHESVAFAAQYHHPVEALASACHVICAVALVKPHFLSYCLFLGLTLMEIVDSHCGYDVPWAVLYPWSGHYPWGSGARLHDYHHSHNLGTFGGGITGLWDWAFGTDADFRAYEKQRILNSSQQKSS